MDKNFVKKELLKNKTLAYFSHFNLSKLYYNVSVDGQIYQFPIDTIKVIHLYNEIGGSYQTIELAPDTCGAKFKNMMKGSLLNRWIERAIESENFVKLSE